jgi:hypothetical protein
MYLLQNCLFKVKDKGGDLWVIMAFCGIYMAISALQQNTYLVYIRKIHTKITQKSVK